MDFREKIPIYTRILTQLAMGKYLVYDGKYCDPETGELIDGNIKVVKVKKTDEEFFRVYARVIGGLYGIESAAAFKVFFKFCELAEWNTGKIRLYPDVKKDLLADLDIGQATLYTAIKQLEKFGIISKWARNVWLLSSELVWKGTETERQKVLHAGFTMTISPDFSEGTESEK